MNRAVRWWNDHRTVARYEDGRWVPAPMRIERAWAWLFRRGDPVRPVPRIFWILCAAALITNDMLAPRFGWWLFLHPQVAAGIRMGLYVAAGVAATGVVIMVAGLLLGRRRRRADIIREPRDASRLPPHE